MRAFSQSLKWGRAKLKRLADIERDLVVVRIGDVRVLDAYADLSTLAKSQGWALFHGKNDLWVGAAAFATQSHLLTFDEDFLPLRGRAGWQVTILDQKTGQARP
jgi:predicted nucleic acid-binding protein